MSGNVVERRLEAVTPEVQQRRQDIENLQTLELEKLLELTAFRKFMHRMLADAGVLNSVMTGNSHTFYKSGQQDLGHKLLAELVRVGGPDTLDLLSVQRYGDDSYV